MAESHVLGMNAKIYIGDPGGTPSTEMTNVKDVTLTLSTGEADITTRANSGWRATVSTLKECTVEFEMVWLPGDAGFDYIKAAYLANTLIALKILDKASGEGPDGDFAVTNFSRNEALEEAIKVSVSCKLSVYRTWVAAV